MNLLGSSSFYSKVPTLIQRSYHISNIAIDKHYFCIPRNNTSSPVDISRLSRSLSRKYFPKFRNSTVTAQNIKVVNPLTGRKAESVSMAATNGEVVTADPQLPPSGPSSKEHGFEREEMYSSKLVGTVKEYNTQIFVVVDKNVNEWPRNVEAPEFHLLSSKLGEVLKARKKDISKKVKFTVVEGTGAGGKSGDILVLPDMIKYTGLTAEDAEQFVEEALIGTAEKKLKTETLQGHQLFVCAHTSHDMRCGVCGPVLVDKFREAISDRGIQGSVWPCSHIGGHKYAGNIIAYTTRPDGTQAGDWYGYVTPNDIPALLDAFKNGEVIDKLWRGGLDMDGAAQEAAQAKRMEGCGNNCHCVGEPEGEGEGVKKKSLFSSPTTWDQSTQTALLCTAVALVAIGVAWYIRSKAAGTI